MCSLKLMAMLALLLAISLLSSCVTYNKCLEKFGHSAPAVKVPALFSKEVPADNASFGVTRSELVEMEVGASKKAAGEKVVGKITKTGTDSYQVDCDTETDTLYVPGEVTCPPTTIFQPDPVIVEVTPWWNKLLIGALLLFSAYLSFRVWLSGRNITIKLPEANGKI